MYDHLNFEDISKYYDIEQYNKSFPKNRNDILSIVHFNIRSIGKNGNEMISLLDTLTQQPDIIAISESFLDSDNIDSFHLENYQGFHSVRNTSKRGGVSIFLKQSLTVDNIEELSFINGEIEICTIILKFHNINYTISCI